MRPLLVATAVAVVAASHARAGGFVAGAGAEVDSENGLAGSLLLDIGIGANTWLFGAAGGTRIETPGQPEFTTVFGEVGVDHYFDPAGVRFSVAYSGDSEFLESNDAMLTVYSRSDRNMLGIDLEYRDLNLLLPALGPIPARDVPFSATGLGFHGRIGMTEKLDFRISGRKYDYDTDIRIETSDRILDLLSLSRLSRLSVLSSLVDWRAAAGIGLDFGSRRLQFDVSQWEGVADGSSNTGLTLSFLTPLTQRFDIEISAGYDDSNIYGEVSVVSLYVYYYGGN